jgi:hypothetical protein
MMGLISLRERDDLATLLLSIAIVPLAWLVLGWRPGLQVSTGDAVLQALPTLRELAFSGGSWAAFAYRAEFLGGWKASDTIGPFPVYSLLTRLAFSPTAIVNTTVFLVQASLAYFGTRAAGDLLRLLHPEARRLGFAERAAGALLLAFAPYLGWRIESGHLNLLVGLLPFCALFALVCASLAGTASTTLVVTAALGCFLGLLFTGQQLILYGAVFGAPVLVGVWLSVRGRPRHLIVATLTLLASLLFALPQLQGMLAHALGSDASRGLGRESVTYSYAPAAPSDWLASLPWTRHSIRHERPEQNELNLPVGPMLLLPLALLWRGRRRWVAMCLIAAIVAMLQFSLNQRPLSGWLLALVPPLNDFRVASRAALPLLSVLPALALAALLQAAPPDAGGAKARRVALAAALPAALLLFLAPPWPREAAAWGLVVLLCAWPRARSLAAGAALVALAGASLGSFRERLQPFPDGGAVLRRAARIGVTMRDAKPELRSPLHRIAMGFALREFAANTAFAAGLSSLEGYYAPSRRFGTLLYALRGSPYEPTRSYFRIHPDEPAFIALRQLYNVRWRLRRPPHPGAAPKVLDFGPTAGPAWFSASVSRVADLAKLGDELRAGGGELHRLARETLWLVAADPAAARAPLPALLDAACARARVIAVAAEMHRQRVVADVETEADCPLTFAMNFAETLKAEVLSERGSETAEVFPAYGALAAVRVPAGARHVRIEAIAPRAGAATLWLALGAVALAAACYAARATTPVAGPPEAAPQRL